MAPVEADQERLIEDEVTEVTARFCGASGAVAELGGGGGGEEVEEVVPLASFEGRLWPYVFRATTL